MQSAGDAFRADLARQNIEWQSSYAAIVQIEIVKQLRLRQAEQAAQQQAKDKQDADELELVEALFEFLRRRR